MYYDLFLSPSFFHHKVRLHDQESLDVTSREVEVMVRNGYMGCLGAYVFCEWAGVHTCDQPPWSWEELCRCGL